MTAGISMKRALIGHSGFVGSTLLRQTSYDDLFRSTDIEAIAGRHYGFIVCAGAPAQKWLANKDPRSDAHSIDRLIGALARTTCDRFVLISTVDVFAQPVEVDEDNEPVNANLHAYGLNRRRLERFVKDRFANHLIVRLPALVGPGLRKNVIFDLHNDNNLGAADSRAVFQFYPMVNLSQDIEAAIANGLRLIHLTAEPVSVAEVASAGFGRELRNETAAPPVRYDFRTRHASMFNGHGFYQYTKRESLLAIRAYAQSEPRRGP
jgi:nucleoside-diphosphate-sugar epimerase